MPVFNQSRSRIIKLIFLSAFLVLLAQLFNLQVISGKYAQLAMDNAVYPKIIYPERGIIYDRKGKAILNNSVMYDLMVTPSAVKNIDTLELCSIMGIDTSEFKKRIREAIFKNGYVRPSIFEDLLPLDLQAKFEENSWKFPGFVLVQRPVRTYPFNAGAHIMGYIAEVNQKQIEKSGGFYRMGDYIGQNGLESYYEQVLMGQRGVQHLVKDNLNRLVGSYQNGEFDTAAVAGRGLRTYLDIEVQELAERLLTNKVGAIVAIEPKSGGIIAMASGPNFNPNDLTGPEKNKNFARLQLDVKAPMLNRAIKGQYPPGSTIKLLGALVALDDGVIDPSYGYPCSGRYYACGIGKPACSHSNPGHAANLRLAITNSCNSYFTHLYRMTVENDKYRNVKHGFAHWQQYMNTFGMGVKLGIDLPSEDRGNIPDTSVYNKDYRNSWNSCTNLTLGIGQDKMLATPLQLANAMCIIANKGYYYTPHFVQKIENETETDTSLMNKFRVRHKVFSHVNDEIFEIVTDGMQDVVERGTAGNARIPGITVCGKTGTAENKKVIDGKAIQLEDHSFFVCFAPRENPKIAIAVVVENSGFGNTWAAPIARLMIEKYINDTISQDSKTRFLDYIINKDLMPSYYERLQFKTDSIRAFQWFEMTKDSAYIKSYVFSNSLPLFPQREPDKRKKKKPEPIALTSKELRNEKSRIRRNDEST